MKPTIDLNQFCDKEDGRFAIASPWVRKGFRYATDGRIIVRVPAVGEPDTEGRLPRGEDLFVDVNGIWRRWPKITPCHKCKQTGYITTVCSGCIGCGICECACGHSHQCGCCDGSGRESDSCECRMYGDSIRIDEGKFSRHYAAKVASLPNVEYLVEGDSDPEKDKMIRFRFDGGEGALMAMSGEH